MSRRNPASLDVAFTGPAGTVKAATQISRSQNPDRLALKDLRVTAAGGSLKGSLNIPLEGGPATGTLDGEFASLDAVSALIAQDLHGAATFQIAFSDIGGQQGATGHIEANDFSLTPEGGKRVFVKHLTAATGGDIAKLSQGVPLSLEADGLSYGEIAFDTLSVKGNTNFRGADYKIDAAGNYRGPLTLSAAGTADWATAEKHVDLTTLSGKHRTTEFALVKPAMLTMSEGGLSLKPTSLQIGAGHADLSLERAQGILNGRIKLADLPLAAFNVLTSGSPAGGELSGTADVEIGPDRHSGQARLKVAGLALSPGDSGPDQFDGTLNADWHDDGLKLNGNFTGQGDAKIAVNAAMPLNYDSKSGAFDLPDDGRLTGKVSWNADVGPFWNAFGPDTQLLRGADGRGLDPLGNHRRSDGDGRYFAPGRTLCESRNGHRARQACPPSRSHPP